LNVLSMMIIMKFVLVFLKIIISFCHCGHRLNNQYYTVGVDLLMGSQSKFN